MTTVGSELGVADQMTCRFCEPGFRPTGGMNMINKESRNERIGSIRTEWKRKGRNPQMRKIAAFTQGREIIRAMTDKL